jgi:hypothetical protein
MQMDTNQDTTKTSPPPLHQQNDFIAESPVSSPTKRPRVTSELDLRDVEVPDNYDRQHEDDGRSVDRSDDQEHFRLQAKDPHITQLEKEVPKLFAEVIKNSVSKFTCLLNSHVKAELAMKKLKIMIAKGEIPKSMKITAKMELPESLASFTEQFEQLKMSTEKAAGSILVDARTAALQEASNKLDIEEFTLGEITLLEEMIKSTFDDYDVSTATRILCQKISSQCTTKTREFNFKKFATHQANALKERKQAEAKASVLQDPQPAIKVYIDATIDKRFQKGPQKSKDRPKTNGKEEKKSSEAPKAPKPKVDPKAPKAPKAKQAQQAKSKKKTSKKSTKKSTKRTKKKDTNKKKNKKT